MEKSQIYENSKNTINYLKNENICLNEQVKKLKEEIEKMQVNEK